MSAVTTSAPRGVDVLLRSPAHRMDSARRLVVSMQCQQVAERHFTAARRALRVRDIPTAVSELDAAALWTQRAAAALEGTS